VRAQPVRAELVEAPLFLGSIGEEQKEERPFDKLRANGLMSRPSP
jgi:hypothetical protein